MRGRVLSTWRPNLVTVLAACLLILGLSSSAARLAEAAIVLDQDYDSGSLNVSASTIDMADPNRPAIRVVPRVDAWYAPDGPYFQFRATGVNGLTPQFTQPNASNMTSTHRYWYSYDNRNWILFDNGVKIGVDYRFSNNTPFTQDTVYVAQMLPFPTWRTDELVESVKSSPYVTPTPSADANMVIGRTLGTADGGYYDDCGRTVPAMNLYGFKITDASATGPKVKVVLQSGNHAGEYTGTYAHEGLVLFLLGDDPKAAVLRSKAEFYVYPLVCPEGRHMGMGWTSPEYPNVNHNRLWNDPDPPAVDIQIVEQAMKTDTGCTGVEFFFDFHSWTTATVLEVSIRSNVVGTPFILALKALEPGLTTPVYNDPPTFASGWAVSAGGLNAHYALIPEFGLLAGVDANGYHEYGRHYGLALYEALDDSEPVNQSPAVSAGDDQTISLPAVAGLDGTVTDDGLPNPPGTVTAGWTVVSGPGMVTFANSAAIDTAAGFSTHGTYVLRLTAGDSELSASDDVQIIVNKDLRADFNNDGKVDGLDFLRWQANFNRWPAGGADNADGDANGDGKVDGLDFLIWQAGFNQ